MFENVSYDKYLVEANKKLTSGGAFLTAKDGDTLNTMTIGWGFIGYMWQKPVFIVPVRKSRYTYDLLKNSKEFTVSISFDGMKKELGFCGSHSGRDADKYKEGGLKTIVGTAIDTPIIDGCDLHYECKVVFTQDVDKNALIPEIDASSYSNNDYHTLFFGEIVACYATEK
jgi:flavin reductase (DIM6/NTAB) family NADH-FMN oxidoreductase RutF